MQLKTLPFPEAQTRWPQSGRHILAQYDETNIVVYQAYRPDIADFAVTHQHFGGPFSMTRMSWVKPNFLWMMFRCGWASKVDQERVLAVKMLRSGFEEVLRVAVHASFNADVYGSEVQWKQALSASTVRLQWDPDHDPAGKPLVRRAIQLGLAGEILERYSREWIVKIEDVTEFVKAQGAHVASGQHGLLQVPEERVYVPADEMVRQRLQIDGA